MIITIFRVIFVLNDGRPSVVHFNVVSRIEPPPTALVNNHITSIKITTAVMSSKFMRCSIPTERHKTLNENGN